MQVITLIDRLGCKLPFSLGKELGSGNHGQVFSLRDDSNCVIKLSVIYGPDSLTQYNKIADVLFRLQQYEGFHLPLVYRFGLIHHDETYLIHYHTMDRFQPISEDEGKVFHTILSHEDANRCKQYDSKQLIETLFGLSKGLVFDMSKVIAFYCRIHMSEFMHLDMHSRNILKTKSGDFKLIDLNLIDYRRRIQ